MRLKSSGAAASLVIVAAVLAVTYFPVFERYSRAEHQHQVAKLQEAPAGTLPGGPFTLVDHTGRAVTDRDFRGSFLLVFFGYTHCPDVCPATLAEVSATLKALDEDARHVRPLFITVDPERDTPGVLASYVRAFHPAIVGLTGTPEQIRAVTKAYKAHYAKVPLKSDGKHGHPLRYSVDHSAFVYLMGPDGAFLDVFRFGASPEKMAEKVRELLRKESS